MTIQTLDALFDGTILIPEAPINIKSGTRVRITIESQLTEVEPTPKSFLETAKSLKLQGKPDWSENFLGGKSTRKCVSLFSPTLV